jgi:hypothetical protein
MERRKGRVLAALLTVTALSTLCAGLALGERHQQGNLIVALNGKISPAKLPRHGLAPAAVTISSELSTADGSPPPRVRRIELALAGHSTRFDRAGLPPCPRGRLRNATDAQALVRCGPSLVGHGRLRAEILLPHQAPLRLHAHLLDFNGRPRGGGLAVWVHAFSARPPVSFVLPFVLHHGGRAFPTTFTATMPKSIGAWSHLIAFRMTLGRRYRHRGARRSYLNASCPAPRRFTAGFSFIRAAYTFTGGRSIGDTIVRACRVRR